MRMPGLLCRMSSALFWTLLLLRASRTCNLDCWGGGLDDTALVASKSPFAQDV